MPRCARRSGGEPVNGVQVAAPVRRPAAGRAGGWPRPGRPKAELVLTDAEREQLTRWARRAKTAQALALRAKIVLALRGRADEQARWRPICG